MNVMLLYVLKSEGSSPGRRGFKMAVSADNDFTGTIGGGIMEFKLAEKAKILLQQNENRIIIQHQFHDKEHSSLQSGMICSGSQLNAFIPLSQIDIQTVGEIADAIQSEKKKSMQLSPAGLKITELSKIDLQYNSDADWLYSEPVFQQPVIHIIGGGHVSLALSELMQFLGFYVKLYDDRPGLNTIQQNLFANEKHIVAYETICNYLDLSKEDFVVIMTIGYRTDKLVLKQLLDQDIFYLGLLGSEKKTETLLEELRNEGIAENLLQKVFTPIGINIYSQTTKEIAVSIAAEIIREKNKILPMGRSGSYYKRKD
ncbi:MAG: XdhC family protein [Sphingobacteriales bacterium]